MSHMRNLSGATVSSASDAAGPAQTFFDDRPVSPPWPSPPIGSSEHNGGGGGGDPYPGVYQSMSPQALHDAQQNAQVGPSRGVAGSSGSLRLSVFRENSDDLGDSPTMHGHARR